jgi:hypothetical protein
MRCGTSERREREETYVLQDLGARSIVVGLSLGHTIANLDELSIDVFEASPDRVLDGLWDLLLDEPSGERAEGLVEQVVLRVADGELERVDLDGDVLDVEDGGLVFAGRGKVNFDGETFAAEEDVCETRVLDLWDATLLLEVEGDCWRMVSANKKRKSNRNAPSRMSAWIWLKVRVRLWLCLSGMAE